MFCVYNIREIETVNKHAKVSAIRICCMYKQRMQGNIRGKVIIIDDSETSANWHCERVREIYYIARRFVRYFASFVRYIYSCGKAVRDHSSIERTATAILY